MRSIDMTEKSRVNEPLFDIAKTLIRHLVNKLCLVSAPNNLKPLALPLKHFLL